MLALNTPVWQQNPRTDGSLLHRQDCAAEISVRKSRDHHMSSWQHFVCTANTISKGESHVLSFKQAHVAEGVYFFNFNWRTNSSVVGRILPFVKFDTLRQNGIEILLIRPYDMKCRS